MTQLPIIPPECKADQAAAKLQGRQIFWRKTEPVSSEDCLNCGGLGILWYQFTKGSPQRNPPGGKTPVTYYNNAWYQVETKTYPCPACQDRAKMIQYLFDLSGLDTYEREWRLDYYSLKGKEDAVLKCNSILAQVPRPAGWHIFVGDYGRGKTGMLKCIVAACIRAGVRCKYLRAFDVLAEIKDTYGEVSELDESDLLKSYEQFQLLAIDEVDRISSTPWAMSTMMAILDNRYVKRHSLATLLATNQDPEKLPAGFEYLASRMKDGDRIMVAGRDLREG